MSGHSYKLIYTIVTDPDGKLHITFEPHPEGVDVAEIRRRGVGAADAALIFSVIYPPDGSLSTQFYSMNGKTEEEMTGDEIFKCWSMLAVSLKNDRTLPDWKRGIALHAFTLLQHTLAGDTTTVTVLDRAAELIGKLITQLSAARVKDDAARDELLADAEGFLHNHGARQ